MLFSKLVLVKDFFQAFPHAIELCKETCMMVMYKDVHGIENILESTFSSRGCSGEDYKEGQSITYSVGSSVQFFFSFWRRCSGSSSWKSA